MTLVELIEDLGRWQAEFKSTLMSKRFSPNERDMILDDIEREIENIQAEIISRKEEVINKL